MYTDWKNYFKQYIPDEEYIPDNILSKNLSSLAFFIILGMFASIGLIIKVEGKATTHNSSDPLSIKIQKIRQDVKNLDIKNTYLESEILILNHQLAQIYKVKENQEVIKLSKLTGMNKKIGPGIVLELSDSDRPLKIAENPNAGIIHNTDLLELINNLWANGAEAISINDQRIIAQTDIKCIGSTILINKTRVAPPFLIKAVGDPKKLANSVKNGHAKSLELYGIKYHIEKYERIEIPANGNIILAGVFTPVFDTSKNLFSDKLETYTVTAF
ncbi:MAG: DUF881 domain-containing protein [Candidatus Gastranaerophilales bacterium]|nr:DUF881 domain-containing protein [Candidatus Gastranaerophilales bacterium]